MILLYLSYFDFWTDPRESGSWRPSRSNDRGLEDLQQTKVRSRIHSWTLLFDILDQWNSGLPSCSSSRTLPTTSVTRSKNDLRLDFFLLSSHQGSTSLRFESSVQRSSSSGGLWLRWPTRPGSTRWIIFFSWIEIWNCSLLRRKGCGWVRPRWEWCTCAAATIPTSIRLRGSQFNN